MSGGADPRSTYVDEGVLGSGFLGWAFDAMPADETQPPMPMTHHSGHHHHYARNQPHRPQHPYQVNPGNVGGAGQFAMPQPQARHRSSSGNLQDPGRHSSSSKHFHHHHQLPSANVHGGIPYGNTLVPPPPPARPPVNVGSGGLGAPVASSSSVARRSGGMPAVPGSSQSSTCQYCGKSYSRPDYLSTHIAGKYSVLLFLHVMLWCVLL